MRVNDVDALTSEAAPAVKEKISGERSLLIVADAFGAEFKCEAPEHKLTAATRKSMMLLFARAAALRLQSLADPTGPYGDVD